MLESFIVLETTWFFFSIGKEALFQECLLGHLKRAPQPRQIEWWVKRGGEAEGFLAQSFFVLFSSSKKKKKNLCKIT